MKYRAGFRGPFPWPVMTESLDGGRPELFMVDDAMERRAGGTHRRASKPPRPVPDEPGAADPDIVFHDPRSR